MASTRPFKGLKSHITPYLYLLGVLPDLEVARRTGKVSGEAVRSFRIRRGILAGWRNETLEEFCLKHPKYANRAREHAGVATVDEPDKPIRKSASKLAPHLHLLGKTSDKKIAKKADVTAENVRTFRIRRGILAGWRGETLEDFCAKYPNYADKARVRAVSTPPKKFVRPKPGSTTIKMTAFEITSVVNDNEPETHVVPGANLTEATQFAHDRLRKQNPGLSIRLTEIREIAVMV